MALSILVVSAVEVIEKYAPLIQEHWEEVALNKRVMVLKPDVERYRQLEEQGRLFCLAATEGDCVVGYSANIIATHLHYSDLVICSNDVLFLHPAYRKGGAGLRLMAATEEEAARRGAKLMTWHAKEGTRLNAICQSNGYRVQDILYSKEL